jgi:hypothetical protein
MWSGCYERYAQQSLRALLAPGDVFIDIGAHVGYHAVLGACVVGSRGWVFAFLTDPKNFVRLEDHLHGFPWGTAVNKAIWSARPCVIWREAITFP